MGSFKIILVYYDIIFRGTIFSTSPLLQYIIGFAEMTKKLKKKKIRRFSINQESSQLESFQPYILPTHIASALPQLNQYNSSCCLYYMHCCSSEPQSFTSGLSIHQFHYLTHHFNVMLVFVLFLNKMVRKFIKVSQEILRQKKRTRETLAIWPVWSNNTLPPPLKYLQQKKKELKFHPTTTRHEEKKGFKTEQCQKQT